MESTKNVRINIHFMLDDAGGSNFQENHDGYGSPNYNGYMFAEDMVERANELWAVQDDGTYGAWQYNSTANRYIPMRVRLLLTGVYFHKNSYWNSYSEGNSQFPSAWTVNTTYGVDTWNTINVYIAGNPNNGGIACGIGGICGNSNGLAVKLINSWHTYSQYPSWAVEYSADLLNHELGHVFGLYHDFEGTNTPTSLTPYGDRCEDTPIHPNCWSIWDTTPMSCLNNWAVQTNNVMSYSEHIGTLTPCQINRVHTSLSGVQQNYVHSCDNCIPANAFFKLDTPICARANVSGGYHQVGVLLDGRGSFNEDSYLIEIFETNANGSNTSVGNYFSQQYTGSVGKINLATFCGYNFQINKHYRIKLVTSKTDCLPQSQQVAWIYVTACDLASTPTTPITPRPKSLTISSQTPKNYLLISDTEQIVNIAIYDFMGRVLYKQSKINLHTGDNNLDLSNLSMLLSNNFYILAVQTTENIETHRFLMP
jgi:hypothetical protein